MITLMKRPDRSSGGAWRMRASVMLLGCVAIAGCDFTVTNPGPISDEALDNESAHAAVVAGAARALGSALNELIRTSAALARESTARAGNFGADPMVQQGQVDPNRSTEWNQGHRARFLAEDAVRRLRSTIGADEFDTYEHGARALLWAGFANRYLGENMCQAVIDGGPAEPHTIHFDRAIAQFTEALEIARRLQSTELEHSALAGRASVRLWIGDWAGAVADAGEIPLDFVFAMPYHDLSNDERNLMWVGNASLPFRAWTVWNTVHEDYFTATGDPRTPWDTLPGQPDIDAAIVGGALPPHLRQMKFDQPDSPINLVSGREMRLIIAEARLRAGAWEEAMDIINALRVDVGVDPWVAAGEDDAWTHLKRERGIELWLEGRRFGDMRRWIAEGVPGEFHTLEVDGGEVPFAATRDWCYPIAESERNTNPNL